MYSQPTLFDAVWAKKGTFLFVFFCVFTLTYGILFAVDFLPQVPGSEIKNSATNQVATTTASQHDEEVTAVDATVAIMTDESEAEVPTAMRITKLNRDLVVLNPTSGTIAALDAALLKGVVRHPDSGLVGQEGNILLLGHSSYLPTVFNKNYQAFNGIQKLGFGDTIVLSASNREYTYRVEKVYEAKASAIAVPTEVTGHRLTLITCDSFGAKEDRFVVEATLVSEKAI